MKVLLIHQSFVTQDEAGGTRHYELAKYLVSRGHQVAVVTSPYSYLTGQKAKDARRADEGLEVRLVWTLPTTGRGFLGRVLAFISFMSAAFFAALRVRRVDVVWGTSPPIFQAACAYLVARLTRKPLCLEIRDLWPAFAVEMGILKSKPLIWASEWLERRLYRRADRVILNSPGFLPHVVASGAPTHIIDVIPNGVDVASFKCPGRREAVRRSLGLDTSLFVAMYAGAHGAANDLGVVLEAASLLRGLPDVRVVLVGDGGQRASLVRQAETMGLHNVIFAAAQPKSRMPEILAAADICIATLKPIPMFRTVYPNKVFDYMAAGKPTVLAIDGVIRGVIEAAQGGLFVSPGDANGLSQAILAYYQDRELVRRHGENARAFVEQHFDRHLQATRLEQVLEALARR